MLRILITNTAFGDLSNLMAYFESTFKVTLGSANGDLPGNLRIGAFYDPRDRVEGAGDSSFVVCIVWIIQLLDIIR